MSIDPSDRRRHERISLDGRKAVLTVDGEVFDVVVTNISLGGFQVTSRYKCEGEKTVLMQLEDDSSEFVARLVRCFDNNDGTYVCGFAVELDEPMDRLAWVELVESIKEG